LFRYILFFDIHRRSAQNNYYTHFLPKANCPSCKWPWEVAEDEHDPTVLKLSNFNHAIRRELLRHGYMRWAVGNVRRNILEADVQKSQEVLLWLKVGGVLYSPFLCILIGFAVLLETPRAAPRSCTAVGGIPCRAIHRPRRYTVK